MRFDFQRLFWLPGLLPAAHAVLSVTLDYGTFNGLANATEGIIYFRGIRYADAPVADLRWKAPVSPPTTHMGTVEATAYGDACIAVNQATVTPGTSEDCLSVNIFIPYGTNTTSKLPVLVYFHGGGFEGGDATTFPPENIIQGAASPLIFVTFQYRLGQFGFLGGSALKENGVLNAGLLDQKAGLEWLQRYITKFGGDPRKVTIWGESAGAGATMFHLIANGGTNGNLFRAAMGDSPSLSFLPEYNSTYIEGIYSQFVDFTNCTGLADSATLACLRALPADSIALAGNEVYLNRTASIFAFGPYTDGVFIQQRPVEAFKSGAFARVPVLFGSNTDEGANWSASSADPAANTSNPLATQTTVYNFLAGQFATLTRESFNTAVAKYYPLEAYNNSFSLQGQQMYGELRYICSALLITGAATNFGLPGYQYHWDNPTIGSDHGADLNAFFDGTEVFDNADQALFVAMRRWFTSFAISGDAPVAADAITWERATTSSGSPRILLHPGATAMENITEALRARCNFWHSLSSEIST
ncbi:Carboxylic ester hydrolase [Mycena chlorophos]|uniref:Carboxylic ester hydrolase n=1 Tax=Mycena chlorophos TaxID=658473 RepID=A0A8H6S325_MYCCL|nr:Carboxylic ester hydrolase [Mycena chlorophos]